MKADSVILTEPIRRQLAGPTAMALVTAGVHFEAIPGGDNMYSFRLPSSAKRFLPACCIEATKGGHK